MELDLLEQKPIAYRFIWQQRPASSSKLLTYRYNQLDKAIGL
jgi:hypothetical protein